MSASVRRTNSRNDHLKKILAKADPGFFLGGSAPLRNDVTDGEVKKCKREYVNTKTKTSSQGGGGGRTPCTLPLDPPLTRDHGYNQNGYDTRPRNRSSTLVDKQINQMMP